MRRSLLLPAVAVLAFAYMTWHVVTSAKSLPQVEPLVAPARASYGDVVAGVGLVEPRSENVHVGAIVPGAVTAVEAKVGQLAHRGMVLFKLDDRIRRAELAVREAALREAEATLARWQQLPRTEDVPASEARVARFAAELKLREDQLRRAEELVRQRVLTDQELIERRQTLESVRAQLEQARAEEARLKAGAWEADLAVARAQVEKAQSLVDQARVEVERLVVRSPIAGTVLKVDVRVGEYVGAPPEKPLVVLGDLTELHVRVDLDEHDLARFDPGVPGEGYVRGQPAEPLPLRFVRVEPWAQGKRSLTGAGDERVDTRVLQVIYAIEATSPRLYVGQQLDVFLRPAGATTAVGQVASSPRRVRSARTR